MITQSTTWKYQCDSCGNHITTNTNGIPPYWKLISIYPLINNMLIYKELFCPSCYKMYKVAKDNIKKSIKG